MAGRGTEKELLEPSQAGNERASSVSLALNPTPAQHHSPALTSSPLASLSKQMH